MTAKRKKKSDNSQTHDRNQVPPLQSGLGGHNGKNEMGKYDSTNDTLLHIKRVNQLLISAAQIFLTRAQVHDNSKLGPVEKPLFDEYTPKLKNSTYGSDEYKEFLKELKVALDHHYEMNSHHPEHYENGINGFDLFDLVEMFMDWKAATERHDDGDIMKSIDINRERFGISEQLCDIFRNTVKRYFTNEA